MEDEPTLWQRIRNLPIDLQERILNEAYPHPLTRAAAQERRPLLSESRRLLRYDPMLVGPNLPVGMRTNLTRDQRVLSQHWRQSSNYRAIKAAIQRIYGRILEMYNTAFWTPITSGVSNLIGPMYGPGLSRSDGLDHNRRGPAWHRPRYNQYIRSGYGYVRHPFYEYDAPS